MAIRDWSLPWPVAILFGLGVGAIMLAAGMSLAIREGAIYQDRSFFGVLKVSETFIPNIGGKVRMLAHGTTLHGAQAQDPTFTLAAQRLPPRVTREIIAQTRDVYHAVELRPTTDQESTVQSLVWEARRTVKARLLGDRR